MQTQRAETIKAGDVIMPPDAELRGWMRKHITERNLPESALHLVVKEVVEGKPDKRGRWLRIRTQYKDTLAFHLFPFNFKARPHTPWQIVEVAQ